MTMNYEKITLQRFNERLKQNTYKNITAARRAIGKADWGEQERQKAHLLSNKFFNVSAAASGTSTKSASKSADTRPLKGARTTEVARLGMPVDPTERHVSPLDVTSMSAADVIAFFGVANESIETMRKSAEIDPSIRPSLVAANAWLGAVLQTVGFQLLGRIGVVIASVAGKTKEVGRKVSPQSYVSVPSLVDGVASRSAAGGR